MHAVPSKKKGLTTRWTYRYREWVSINEVEYNKIFASSPHKVRNQNGKFFIQRYKTVPLERIPTYLTRKEAEDNMYKHEAIFDARLREREKRESWHDKYYNYTALVDTYTKSRKESALNSWESKITWFKSYVLTYFLLEKHTANLEEWKHHFKSFKDWLRDVKGSRTGKVISYASKNHCINELNYFLNLMWEEGHCDPQPKLSLFPEKLVNNHKGASDLISDDEFLKIYNCLKLNEEKEKVGSYFSDAYYILRHSGMRINELLGIGLNNVRPGKPSRDELNDLLKASNINDIYSYIFLMSQPKEKERFDGKEILWKPLKGKTGSMKDARYIPITDPLAHNILRKYYNKAKEDKSKGIYGDNNANYAFFFDHVTAPMMRNRIYKAYETLGMVDMFKSTYHTRHTKTSSIVKESKGMSDELAQLIIGHVKGSKSTQRYNLLYKEIVETEINEDKLNDEFLEVEIKAKA